MHRFSGLLVLASILVACGGMQSSVSGPLPHTKNTSHVRPDRSGSWTDTASSYGLLLYVALPFNRIVNIYTVPGAQLVGQIKGLRYPWALCSDNSGDVWVADEPTYYRTTIAEYAHGGTSPIRTLRDTNGAVQACAYDSTTGNLAAASAYDYSRGAYVDVYAHARGKPIIYRPASVWLPNSVAFDSLGDLFLAGKDGPYAAGTDWLRKGSSTFAILKLKKPHTYPHSGIVISGTELIEIAHPSLINEYAITEGKAKYNGSFTLDVPGNIGFVSLTNSTLAASDFSSNVYLFNYPGGGSPTVTISGLYEPQGVTLSVAPTGSHTRK